MRRLFVLPLAWFGLATLSCSVYQPPQQPLFAVSAPPPATAAAPVPTAPAAQEPTAAAPAPVDPAVAATAAFIESRQIGLVQSEIDALARTIIEESRRHDLDPNLVLALIHVESRFDNFAVSKVGALGLMQILPSTGEELAREAGIPWRGARTLFDPVANVKLGTAYVRELADRYDHIPTALAAYNWGPGRIDGRLRRGRPLPKVYSGLVLEAYATKTARVARS